MKAIHNNNTNEYKPAGAMRRCITVEASNSPCDRGSLCEGEAGGKGIRINALVRVVKKKGKRGGLCGRREWAGYFV